MARPQSKIMSIAEKKVALTNLKAAMATHRMVLKNIGFEQMEANKVLALAKKTADASVKSTHKTAEAAYKAANRALDDATKTHTAASASVAKRLAAGEKGTARLTADTAVIEAVVPAVPAVVSRRTKSNIISGTSALHQGTPVGSSA